MKHLIYTTIGAIIICFVIGYFWSRFHTTPTIILQESVTIQEERPKVALGASAVARFFVECGIRGADHALVRDFLLGEDPQAIDLSTKSQASALEDHMKCLTDTEIKQGFINGKKSLNQMNKEKASTGLVKEKNRRNHTKP